MKNLSYTFRDNLKNGHLSYTVAIEMVYFNGIKQTFNQNDIWESGIAFENSISSRSSFNVGSAIIDKCTIKLNNIDDQLSDKNFRDAEFKVILKSTIGEGDSIFSKTYTVAENPKFNGGIITLVGYDYLQKLDKPCGDSLIRGKVSSVELIQKACEHCNLLFDSESLNKNFDGFVVNIPDDTRKTSTWTWRQVILWLTQLRGTWAEIKDNNRLFFGNWNISSFEKALKNKASYDEIEDKNKFIVDFEKTGNERCHHLITDLFSEQICTDNVEITGIQAVRKFKKGNVTKNEKVLAGTNGYVIEIKGNQLLAEFSEDEKFYQKTLNHVLSKYKSISFRPLKVTTYFNPEIEVGDVALVCDYKNRTYVTLITEVKHVVSGSTTISCNAMPPIRQQIISANNTEDTLIELEHKIEVEKNSREKALEELTSSVAERTGLYCSKNETSDGFIYFLHDKKKLSDSNIIWKMTKSAFAVSTDGGHTYNAGLTVDGNLITNLIEATGINANWIKSGALEVKKGERQTLYVNCDTGEVRIDADTVTIGSNSLTDKINQIEKAPEDLYEYTDSKYSEVKQEIFDENNEINKQIKFVSDKTAEISKSLSDISTKVTESTKQYDELTGRMVEISESSSAIKQTSEDIQTIFNKLEEVDGQFKQVTAMFKQTVINGEPHQIIGFNDIDDNSIKIDITPKEIRFMQGGKVLSKYGAQRSENRSTTVLNDLKIGPFSLTYDEKSGTVSFAEVGDE